LADQAGLDRASAQCGTVTLIQRFGSALNLNIHFHFNMLWLDGVCQEDIEQPRRKPRLHRARAPTSAQLTQLADTIAHRVCRHLARQGWLEGEDESAFLSDRAGCDDGLDALRMSSITYRIATGAQAGRKVTTLQTIPADNGSTKGDAGKVSGLSLHAGVAAEAHESQKLERLCRYIARRSARSAYRSRRRAQRYQLKTPWRNGTTHVEFEPVDVMAHIPVRHPAGDLRSSKSAILPIRHRQTRGVGAATARPPDPLPRRLYSGHPALRPPSHPSAVRIRSGRICAPNAKLRTQLTPSGRGKRPATDVASAGANVDDLSPIDRWRAMTWAQRLKRVFGIDVKTCIHCGGSVRSVASIEEPKAIRAILDHFAKHGAMEPAHDRPAARAPPAVAA